MTLHIWGEFNVHFSFDQRVGVHLRVRLSMSEVPRTIGPRAVAQTVIALLVARKPNKSIVQSVRK